MIRVEDIKIDELIAQGHGDSNILDDFTSRETPYSQ